MFKSGYVQLLAPVAVALSVLAAAGPAHASGDTVIAIVNGDKIYKKDVQAAIKTLPPEMAADEKGIFPQVVDQLINQKLIDDATAAARITESEEYKTALEDEQKAFDAAKLQLPKKIYIEHVLKKKVTEPAVKAEYDKIKQKNQGQQEIYVRHILVKTKEEAAQAIKDLDDGAKFEDLAKQRSSDTVSAQHGGELGWMGKEDLAEFSEAAFKVPVGEYSKEPVHSRFGWEVIKVDDKRAREFPPLDGKVADAIRNKLAQDAVSELVKRLRDKAQIKMFDTEGKPLVYGNGKSEKGADKGDKPAHGKKAHAKPDAEAPAADAGGGGSDAPAPAPKPADSGSYGEVEKSGDGQ